jgi:hypothetical protein
LKRILFLFALCGTFLHANDSIDEGVPSNDPFVRFLEKTSRNSKVPFVIKEWIYKIVEGQFVEASHLTGAVQREARSEDLPLVHSAALFVFWKMGLEESFARTFYDFQSSEEFLKSEARVQLLRSLEFPVTDWLRKNTFALSNSEKELFVKNAPPLWQDALRPYNGESLLKLLSERDDVPMKWVEKAAIYLLKNGKPEEALELVDDKGSTAFRKLGSEFEKNRYKLLRARILYQMGSLREALKVYSSLDTTSPEFPLAAEEKAWVLARMAMYGPLRGELESLEKPIYKNLFQPEVYVLSAILDLKLCRFSEVEKKFQAFESRFRPWAAQAQDVLKTKNGIENTPWKDEALLDALATSDRVTNEIKQVERLEVESVSAPLTAVGQQSHWTALKRKLSLGLAEANVQVEKQRVRIWKQAATNLKEAIQKLQFVKVELLSQASLGQAAASVDASALAKSHVKVTASQSGIQSYPYDAREFWPDELFRVRGVVNQNCLGAR